MGENGTESQVLSRFELLTLVLAACSHYGFSSCLRTYLLVHSLI
jgi:hypothetical protein